MLTIFKKLFDFSGKNKKTLIQSFILSTLFTVFEILPILAITFSIKAIVAGGKGRITPAVIIIVVLLMMASLIGKIVFGSLANAKTKTACFDMCADKRIAIGDRLKRMPMGYFNSHRLGEIASIVTTTISDVENQAGHMINNLVVGIIHAIVVTGVIVYFDWRLGLVSVAAVLSGLGINHWMQKENRMMTPKRQEAQSGLVAAILEVIQGIAVIKSYNLGNQSQRQVDQAIEESRKKNLKLEEMVVRLVSFYILVFKTASCGLVLMAGYGLTGGTFSLTNTLAITVASFVVFAQIEQIGSAIPLLCLMETSMDKVMALEKMPLMDEHGQTIHPENYEISFKNVSFSYDSKPVLENINLTIPQQSTLAIVGPSGAGKSTLCSLIPRFWDADYGSVELGGVDVRDYSGQSLLENISMVFQNVYLFQDTVENNIRFGRANASHQDIIAAASKACCHQFIMALPQGYQTVIGEGGCSLSGGERQRISIARAMLKNAPIVILDEATASLDPENELQIQAAIEALTEDKTVIMIAHRLATVRNADSIIVLEKGRIVQQGSHDELIRHQGIYRNFIDLRESSLGWRLAGQSS